MNLLRNRLAHLRSTLYIRLLQQPPRVGGDAHTLTLNNLFAMLTASHSIKVDGIWVMIPSKYAWSTEYELL